MIWIADDSMDAKAGAIDPAVLNKLIGIVLNRLSPRYGMLRFYGKKGNYIDLKWCHLNPGTNRVRTRVET